RRAVDEQVGTIKHRAPGELREGDFVADLQAHAAPLGAEHPRQVSQAVVAGLIRLVTVRQRDLREGRLWYTLRRPLPSASTTEFRHIRCSSTGPYRPQVRAAGGPRCPWITQHALMVTPCVATGSGVIEGAAARNGIRSRRDGGAPARRVPLRAARRV